MSTFYKSLDVVIFVIYLASMIGMGLYFSRRKQTQESYFVGNKKMPWFAVGLSIFAASFSSVGFLAYPREGAYEDYHLFWALLLIPLFITPVLAFVFVPLYHRLGVNSVYEYLEVRFSRPLRRVGTILFAGYAIGWLGGMLYAMGLVIQAVVGLTTAQMVLVVIAIGMIAMLYTALGGVEAVIWNDVLQTFTLGGGIILIFILAVHRIDGGLASLIDLGSANQKFEMFDLRFDLYERRNFYSATAFGLFMYLPGYVVSQVMVQKYLCMDNVKKMRQSLLANCTVGTLVSLVFFMVGSAMFAFYHQSGASGFPDIPKQDQLLPHFVARVLSVPGLIGLMFAGLFAAGLSTIDGGLSSLAAVFVYDWMPGRQVSVRFSKLLTMLFGILVIGAGIAAPFIGEHLIEIINKVAGTFLGLILGIYLLGMFVPRANSAGAFIGLFAAVIALVLVWTRTHVPHWWYGAVTSFTGLSVGAVASFLFPKPDGEKLRGLFFQKSDGKANGV